MSVLTYTPISAPDAQWHQLFAVDFVAEVSWEALTRLRRETGVPNLGYLDSPTTHPVAGTLLESGAWGDAWLTMLPVGDTSWRIVATSQRDHSPNLDAHLELAHRMISCLGGTVVEYDSEQPEAA